MRDFKFRLILFYRALPHPLSRELPPGGSLIKSLLQWEKAFLVCLMIEVFSPYFYFLVYKYIFVWYNKFATQI